MSVDITHLACAREQTSFIIGEKVKKYGQWTTYDDYYLTFSIWEVRTPDPRSKQVAIRHSSQVIWVQEPLIPGVKNMVSQQINDKLFKDAE